MKASIIIPFYNRYDLTFARLVELYKYIPREHEIILVDDASPELDSRGGIAYWQKYKTHKIRYFRNEENKGFGGSMNIGAKIAMKYHSDLLIFLSNDVKVSGNFIPLIEGKYAKSLICNEQITHKAGWNEFIIDGKLYIVPYANGWFLACAPEAWKELGGFDLRYGKYDFEDVDLSMRALELGYNINALNTTLLQHMGASTIGYTEERLEHTKHNKEIFFEKWKNIIPNILKAEN